MNAGSPTFFAPFVLNGVQVTVKSRAKLNATGERSALTEALFTIAAVPAAPGNLAISEIHYNPSGASDGTEFVELVNISASRLDLTGVSFTGAMIFTFGNVTLEPGARICVVENTAAFSAGYVPTPTVAGQWSGALNKSGDTIILRDKSAVEIERVTYSDQPPWTADADGGGYSLERLNTCTNADIALNWRASTALNGNPGASDATAFTCTALADADGDGLPALLEYLLATSDTAPTPAAVIASRTSDGRATLIFPRRLSADDVGYFVESSANLATWTNAATRTTQVRNGDGSVMETRNADVAAARQFMRVRVVKP